MQISVEHFPEIRWHGHWIWIPEEPIEPEGFWTSERKPNATTTHALFRKSFVVDAVPDVVPARISADSRYALFLNGVQVSRGPIRSQPRRLHYDMLDLAPHLVAGQNMLSVYVKHYRAANSFWMPAVPNNTLGRSGVLVFEANLGAEWLVSDESWKACRATAWDELSAETIHVPIELFDARRFPYQWQTATFDDGNWGAAQKVAAMHVGGYARTQPPTDPYGPLYPRPIAMLGGACRKPAHICVEQLGAGVQVASDNPAHVVQASLTDAVVLKSAETALPTNINLPPDHAVRLSIDMGRVVSGFVTFKLDAPSGTTLDISYTEDPLQSTFSMDKMESGSRYIARGHDDSFQLFEPVGFRYAYLLIHGASGTINLQQFNVQESVYPWRDAGSFACSDPQLNAIFAAGQRTVELCSQDAFVDCPTREQRAWVGDGVVHQMVHLATNGDWRLAQRFLTLGNAPRADGILPMSVASDFETRNGFTIPDWSLHWLHGLYNWYRYSGDKQFVKALMPTAEGCLRWYLPYLTKLGVLKDVPEWNLIDWSSISNEDTSAAITALWARGLWEFAEMAGWLGENASQQWAANQHDTVRDGFELFWDERRGSYVDHIVDGAQRAAMSQLTGALAIVAQLAPRERWSRIIATITDERKLVVRSWMGNGQGQQSAEKWQQQVRAGRYDINWDVEHEIVLAQPFMSYVVHDAVAQAGAAAQLPDLYRRWSQFLQDGYDTIGECWDFGTHAHGWSCTPTRDMIFYTLGVTPAEPGFTRARIAPRLGSLEWAMGVVPTPHGPIRVYVTRDSVEVESPVPYEIG